MPYKDPQRKEEWERRHRQQRLARRRDLRRIKAVRNVTQPASPESADEDGFPLQLLVGGGALALYNPTLALGVGGVTVIVAALRKTTWHWWVLGLTIVAIALFLLLSDRSNEQ